MTFKVIAYYKKATKITFELDGSVREELVFYDYDAAKRFVNHLKDDWVYSRYRFQIVHVQGELIPPTTVEQTKALVCQ